MAAYSCAPMASSSNELLRLDQSGRSDSAALGGRRLETPLPSNFFFSPSTGSATSTASISATMGYLVVGVGALVAYYIISSIAAWHRLRHFKGPFLASFSYLWMARTALSGLAWKIHLDNREKYGEPLIRIGPDVLITDEPEIIRQINAARSSYTKSMWYNALRANPYVHAMISTTDAASHHDIKSKATPAYAGKDVPTMEDDVDGQIASFKDLIRRKYLSTDTDTKPMDFANGALYLALDIITKLAFGREWGFIAVDGDVDDFIGTTNEVSHLVALACDVPWAQKIFSSDVMLKLMGPKETDQKGLGKMMGSVQVPRTPNQGIGLICLVGSLWK